MLMLRTGRVREGRAPCVGDRWCTQGEVQHATPHTNPTSNRDSEYEGGEKQSREAGQEICQE